MQLRLYFKICIANSKQYKSNTNHVSLQSKYMNKPSKFTLYRIYFSLYSMARKRPASSRGRARQPATA
jgi:hypothetical protein